MERRYVEILTIVVVLVAGDTGRAWIWSMVTGAPSSARKDIPQIPRHQKHHHYLRSSAQRAGPFSISKLVSLFSVMRYLP